MQPENLNMDEINEERRKSIAESIHLISDKELKALGEKVFPFLDHPWRHAFFDFISQNAGATFYHATTKNDGIHVIYCPSKEKGIWFLPNGGAGPLQAWGLKILKEIVVAA
jgi:hypothetical protein